ncbi:MAG TPA: GNAT family N-acetyltransferase [Virgibacillus sp.]|nr:GNAT family N-acetyltransferase [Virgibacillus sp.]
MNILKIKNDADLNQAFEIRKKVFIQEQHVPAEEEMDEHDDTAIHFLGLEDEEPIATSRLRFVDQYGKLERICVLPDCRGQSFGKQMILFMEKTISENGYTMSKLNAQTHAEEFYKRLGYETTSDIFMDAGIPHVTMVKKLS